jgi:hypothetical protein
MVDGFTKIQGGKRYQSRGYAAKRRYGRHPRTLKRWQVDPKIKFPFPDLVINGHEYYCDETLNEFDARMKARSHQSPNNQSEKRTPELPTSGR